MTSFTPDYTNAIVSPSPNYWSSRQGYGINYIVVHGTAGLMPGCLNWLDDPQSGASVHYLVDRNGTIYQLVKENHAAWGNGIPEPPSSFVGGPNPNNLTLSIEAERDQANTSPITKKQQAALIALCTDIRRRYGPVPIIPHSAISPQSRGQCPGPGYPLAEIDQASQHQGPQNITWVRFTGTPQHLPLVFYADASFKTPLYPSAATQATTINFDGWCEGVSVLDPSTKKENHIWVHRNNPNGNQGWTPRAWVKTSQI